MGYRQYIGARYVPKYDGPWNSTKIYEPLTIVDDANGNSYTSRKTVPAGTALTDRVYWAPTGSFSGAIIALQNRVTNIEDHITDVDTFISDLQQSVAAIDGDLATIQNDVTALQRDVESMQINRFVCVSDSYGTHSVNNWMTYLARLLQIDTQDTFVFAEGGCGFEHEGNSGHTFKTLLQSNISSITSRDTIDAVFIGGGTNDFAYFSSDAGFTATVDDTVNYVKAQFPNAKVYLVYMGYWTGMSNTQRINMQKVMAAYALRGANDGCVYIDASLPMHIYDYREDGMHPNEIGGFAIAAEIYNSIKGGTGKITIAGYNSSVYCAIPIVAGTGINFLDAHEKTIYQEVVGNVTYLRFGRQALAYDNPQTIGGDNVVPIGRIDVNRYPHFDSLTRIQTYARIQKSDSSIISFTPVELSMAASGIMTGYYDILLKAPFEPAMQIAAVTLNQMSVTVPTILF